MSFEKLGDICDVIDSLHKTPKYSDIGKPMVRCTDVKYGELNLSNTFKVSDEVFNEFSKRYNPEVNDIIITRVGSYGITAQVKDINFCLGQNTSAIKPKNINPDYLYLVLNSKVVKDQIEFSVVGSTQKTLSLKAINHLDIPRFGDEIENQIAIIGASLDDKIVNNAQTNQTLEQMAQAIFKSWFVDFDPVKAKMNGEQPEGMDAATASLFPEKLVESELGLIPEGWDVLPSEKVATVAIGKTPPRKEPQWFSEDSKDVTWISIRDMGNTGTFALDSSEYLTQEAVDKFNVKVIPDNTLILSFKLTVGRVAITHGEMTTNEAIAHYKLSDNARVSTNYLYSYMKQFNFESLGSTSSIAKAVNSKIIKALPVIVPSKEILGSFDSLVKPLFDKIKSNQIENQNLEDLRDTLLPKLLSGEIELGTSEELVEAI
ncbi:restriction endonuclease subunit S [Shewanella xiamenensis]|uniref:restriction endonuclease subunit S n=1 Tax=Shewanella xiamenensis TaxID=332186 RepID=UPI0021C00664|nr:restriction endonuclease subunit S [Shewanella xiamenensis]MCT8869588.1 restriction endonuclease subunit S [Shewanella xiamenensis]